MKLQRISQRNVRSMLSLGLCIAQISRRFFENGVVSINIFYTNNTLADDSILEETMLKLFEVENPQPILIKRSILRNSSSIRIPEVDNYIMLITSQVDIEIFIHILKDLSNQNRRTQIFVASGAIVPDPDFTQKTFEVFGKGNVLKGMVLLAEGKNCIKYRMYTWSLYKLPKYNKRNICSFGVLTPNISSFSESQECANNCKLRVIYQINPPYVKNAELGFQSSNYFVSQGTEMNLLNMIGNHLKFDFVFSKSRFYYASIYENGTATGDIPLLFNNSVDILIGGYVKTLPRHMYLDVGHEFTYEFLVWCTQSIPVVERSPNLINIFSPEIWTLVFIVYVLACCGIWLLSRYNPNESDGYKALSTTFFFNFAVLLGTSLHYLPRSTKVRYVMALFVIFGYEATLLYTSYLTSIISTPRYIEKYNSLKAVFRDNVTTLLVPPAAIYINNESDILQGVPISLIKERWQNCPNVSQCLKIIASSKKHAYCVPKMRVMSMFSESNYNFHCISHDIADFPVNTLMRKGFPHYVAFNRVLYRVLEAGFISKWLRDLIKTKYLLNELSVADFESFSIRLKHLLPLCKLFLFSSFISVVVFLCEIVVYKKPI